MTIISEQDEAARAGFGAVDAGSGEGVEFSMQQLVLTGEILPVGARLLVRHSFRSASPSPVEAVYSFMLPRDATLRRFRVAGPDFSARSELRPVKEATEAYERGIEEGHLATLARSYRDGLINLSIGNLRQDEPVAVWLEILAGVDLRDDGLRFRFPFTLAPSYHRRAKCVLVDETAGEIELLGDEFGDALLPQFRATAKGLHEIGFDLAVRFPGKEFEVASPSHRIKVGLRDGEGRVSMAAGADVPNRDLVLDVVSKPEQRFFAGPGSDGRTQFALAVPSIAFGETPATARAVVFVLDRSGSMGGAPMDQARRALLACLATLSNEDRFGIVAFDDQIEEFGRDLVPATAGNREQARAWLRKIGPRGGTELGAAVKAGARIAQGGADIFLLTDGQVWGGEEILATARTGGHRVHCLGIGSASQDRFLTLLARETGALSRFVTPRERVDSAALDLFAGATAPVAGDLQVTGTEGVRVEPAPPAHVYANMTLLVTGSGADQRGSLRLNSTAGTIEADLRDAMPADGETLRLLRGARLITDEESRLAGEERAVDRRKRDRQERRLRQLSEEYGLASREMALVAVVDRAGDKRGEVPETQVIPVGLPEDMEIGGVFDETAVRLAMPMPSARPYMHAPLSSLISVEQSCESEIHASSEASIEPLNDELFDLAALLEPDGGMPGDTPEERIAASLLALLAFSDSGSGPRRGPFRAHVTRLMHFLDRQRGKLSPDRERVLTRTLGIIRKGHPYTGDWLDHVRQPDPERVWTMFDV